MKFRNPKSGHDGRLVMDTDDGNIYDELVIEQDGDCKQTRGYSDYAVRSNNLFQITMCK